MCGRFAFDGSEEELRERFGVEGRAGGDLLITGEFRPTDPVPVIAAPRGRRLVGPARWSLVPAWSDTDRLRFPTFNARIETALARPAFRDAARGQRCVIPASRYVERGERDGRHVPFVFRGEGVLPIAGLYTWWRRTSAEPWRLTATMLTTAAIPGIAEVHDRMPVLVAPALLDDWLAPEVPGDRALPAVAAAAPGESARLSWTPESPDAARYEL